MLVFAGIAPHPPIIVPSVGKGEEKKAGKTTAAYQQLSRELSESEPDTVIIITPHMVHYPHLFNICGMPALRGDFSSFGDKSFEWQGENNLELANEIVDNAEDEGLPSILYDNGEDEYILDHGATVPLYFFKEALDYKFQVLPISYSYASRAEHFAFGQTIAQVCQRKTTERIALVASGDMSHRLMQGQINESAQKYDREMVKLVGKGDEYSILNIDEKLLEDAGECGYRSTLIMLGALTGRDYSPKVYSYEGPFGVGYMVANMNLEPVK